MHTAKPIFAITALLVGGPNDGEEMALNGGCDSVQVAGSSRDGKWVMSRTGTYKDVGPDDPEDPTRRVFEWRGWSDKSGGLPPCPRCGGRVYPSYHRGEYVCDGVGHSWTSYELLWGAKRHDRSYP